MSNTNFAAIGQLVTEARNLLDSIKGGAIRAMQTQFDSLIISFDSRMNKTITNGLAKINAVASGAKALPESKFQQIIKPSGKAWGKHHLMCVSSSVFVNPESESYKPNQRNGILLWPIGAANDALEIPYGLGFDGVISATRTGWAKQVNSLKIMCMRHWTATYLSIGSDENSIGLRIGTFNYMGKNYQTLISDFNGGGDIMLDGFAALKGNNGLRDENFGRYINDKDNTVLDEFSPIAMAQYK